jgi:hypothetical protein
MAARPRPGCTRRRWPGIRDALRLRLRLMPYLYSAINWAHEAHIPVLAPTFVAFEDDPACFADADAAMFGPCLLAAPVMREGAREVEVYLPAGVESWRDFWTGRVYAAGRSATIPAAPARALQAPLSLKTTACPRRRLDPCDDRAKLDREQRQRLGRGERKLPSALFRDARDLARGRDADGGIVPG